MSTKTSTEWEEKNRDFVSRLRKVCEDRGSAAMLRRWWSPGTRGYALPVLARLGALRPSDPFSSRSLVAALYSLHPIHVEKFGNLGSTCRRIGLDRPTDKDLHYERHFQRILACDSLEELAGVLSHTFRRAQGENLPVNYERLLSDLGQFALAEHRERIRNEWAFSFWNVAKADDEGASKGGSA